MAVANPKMEIDVDFNFEKSEQKFKSDQRKIQQQAQRGEQKVESINEQGQTRRRLDEQRHQDRLRRMRETANQRALLQQQQAQRRQVKSAKSWSAQMTKQVQSVNTAIKGFVIGLVAFNITSMITQTINWAGGLVTFAEAVGLSAVELSALQFQASKTGSRIEALQNSLIRVAQTLGEVRAGGAKRQGEILSKIGIDATSASLSQVLDQLIRYVATADEGGQATERMGDIAVLLGARGARAFGQMATRVGSLSDAIQNAVEVGAVLSDTTGAALDNIGVLAEGAKLKIRVGIADALAKLEPQISSFIKTFVKGFGEIDTVALAGGVIQIAKAISLLGKAFIEFRAGLAVFAAFRTAVAGNISRNILLMSVRFSAWARTVDGVAQTAALVTPKLRSMEIFLMSLTKAVRGAVGPFTTFFRIIGRFAVIITALIAIFDVAKAASLGFFGAIGFALARFAQALTFLLTPFEKMLEAFNNLPQVMQASLPAIRTLLEGIVGVKRATDDAVSIYEKWIEESKNLSTTLSDDVVESLEEYNSALERTKQLTEAILASTRKLTTLAAATLADVGDIGGAAFDTTTVPKPSALGIVTNQPISALDAISARVRELNLELIANAAQIGAQIQAGFNAIFAGIASLTDAEITRHELAMSLAQQRFDLETERIRALGLEESNANVDRIAKRQKAVEAENRASNRLKSKQFEQQKLADIANAIMSTALGVMNSFSAPPPLWPALISLVAATGAIQTGFIAAQKNPYKRRFGGFVPGNGFGDNVPLNVTGGEFVVNRADALRNAEALEFINSGGRAGGGGNISININGDVIGTQDFVEETLMPAIQRGLDNGVAF